MSFHHIVYQQLHKQLASTPADAVTETTLNNSLRLLAKWRCALIQNTVLAQHGTTVLGGPLQGLEFVDHSTEGCHIPKLLGCYEQPLHPFLEQVLQTNYDTVVNIGCAEGYYAVGIARRMRHTQICAFDIDPAAQNACRALAEKNHVAQRVKVAGLFTPADFSQYQRQKVLVICDIEGNEQQLLDPTQAPELVDMDMIIEAHDCFIPGISQTLQQRFAASHDMTVIVDNGQRQLTTAPSWFKQLAHLDQLLAVWEWRSGPTPWIVMKTRR